MKQLRFHLLGLAHLATHRNNSACAYTQKVVKLAKMLKEHGHTLYFYGVEGSEVEADEFIEVSTQEILQKLDVICSIPGKKYRGFHLSLK